MQPQIKICGINSDVAMAAALDAGASHVGLVHYEPSPRHVALLDAGRLRAMARGRAKVVLLLVNATIEVTAQALDAVKPDIVQFHGTETPGWVGLVRAKMHLEVWKALGIKDMDALDYSRRYDGFVDRMLYDAPATALPGGTGTSFDWSLLARYDHTLPWGLAGGLTPANVADAIAQTGAELVDTSSGVESAPGVKDADLIHQFCEAARSAA